MKKVARGKNTFVHRLAYVAGDVTLTVALGAHLDLSDLRVQGVHTLTLAGEGSATLPEPLPAEKKGESR